MLFRIVVGALNAALVFTLWPKIAAWDADRAWPTDARYWLTVLFALGTPHWYLSIGGRVWHAEEVVALCGLLVAVHEAVGRGRVALVHAWLGFSFLCYPPAVCSLPFFWLICGDRLRRAGRPGGRILRSLGGGLLVLGAIIAVGWAGYNNLRFGTPFETGRTQIYLSDVERGLCPPFGLMSVKHIVRNIGVTLWRSPLPVSGQFPFLTLDVQGFSFFWATPALLYVFLAVRPRVLEAACWSGWVPVLACLLMYHSNGATQFGYRRILAALPFLMILSALGMQRCRWRLARPLILASVAINLIGMIWFYSPH